MTRSPTSGTAAEEHTIAPLAHIILVNWNGFDDTHACVESCLALTYPSLQVVVVDNGSADGSGAQLSERFAGEPRVTVLASERNLGFAGGNNLGIRHALEHGAAYVWLLNNDTVVDPEALGELVRAAEAHPDEGMFGSKVYYYDRPQVLWYAGGVIKPHRDGTTYHRGYEEPDAGQYDASERTDYVTGASLLVPARVVERIGLMAEEYFLYWEEVDWCARAAAAGFPSRYVPTSRVWHKVGASLGTGPSPLRVRYDSRNRLLFYARNHREALPRVLWWLNRQIVAFALWRRRPAEARALLRGEIDFMRGRTGPIDVG